MADIYYNTSGTVWTDLGFQYNVALTNSGAYYFRNTVLSAADLYVNTANDYGPGSLRLAIAYANFHAGVDTITFDQSVFNSVAHPTISMNNRGEYVITDSLIIDGPGSTALTIDAGGNSRVFNINSGAANIYVSITGMTLTGGSSVLADGGAIYNNQLLSMKDVVISNSGAVNGGGIYNDATGKIIMDRVTISGNNASADGGGIYNIGAIQMTNTTISNNTATGDGGGIYNGAIRLPNFSVASGTVLAQAVTIDHNSAVSGGGIYTANSFYGYDLTVAHNTTTGINSGAIYIAQDASPSPILTLENATVAYNSNYGIYNNSAATANIFNTIVSYNGPVGAYTNISANVTSGADSIIDHEGQSIFVAGGTLLDNGGWVQTIALSDVSIAINKGLNNGPSLYDARGYMRNGTRDIGAYEYNAVIAVNHNTLVKYTEQQGIQTAINQAANGQTIELVASRIIVGVPLTISHDIILQGQGSGITVLDATGNTQILNINDNLPTNMIYVRVTGISFTGGNSAFGGAIFNTENLLLKDTSFYNNTAFAGGAIYNAGGFIAIDHSELYNNTSSSAGGAVYSVSGGLLITDSTIRDNTAVTGGGGIFSFGASSVLTVSESTFNDNFGGGAGSLGGAVFAAGKALIDNSTFAYNTADSGAGLYLAGNGYWKFTNITVAYNTTTGASGAAFQVEDGNLFMINTLIVNNVDNHNFLQVAGRQNIYNSYIQETADNTIFVTANLVDAGGWSETLMIANSASSVAHIIDKGTNIGVPGYDQRGYGYMNVRDIGAYEYNGAIGILNYLDKAGKANTVRISGIGWNKRFKKQ